MMETNYNKLGMYTMFAGIAAMVFLQTSLGEDLSTRVGLALFFVGFIIMAFGFVMNRLRRIGAEAWALGSIIVYLGFVLFSLPLLIFVAFPDSVPLMYQWLMTFGSVLLIFLGYGTEKWELNQYFLAAYHKAAAAIREGAKLFLNRIRSSYVFLPMLVLLTLLIVSLFTDLEESMAKWFSSNAFTLTGTQVQLILLTSVILLFLIEAREIVKSVLIFVAKWIKLVWLTVLHWVRKFPQVVRTSSRYVWHIVKSIMRLVKRIIENSFIIGFLSFIYFLFQGISNESEIEVAGSFIIFGISISLTLTQQRERVSRVVERVHDSVISRKIAPRVKIGTCPNCGNQLSTKDQLQSHCKYCGASIQKCGVCYGILDSSDNVVACPHCGNLGHVDHLEKWTRYTGSCPFCKQEWHIVSSE